jgi:hypothetical protein
MIQQILWTSMNRPNHHRDRATTKTMIWRRPAQTTRDAVGCQGKDEVWTPRCNGLQTPAPGLASNVDYEPTIGATMRGREPAITANEPIFWVLRTFGDVSSAQRIELKK